MACTPDFELHIAENAGSARVSIECSGECADKAGCIPHWSLDSATYPDVAISGYVTAGPKGQFVVEATGGKSVPFQIDVFCSCGDDNGKSTHVKGVLKYVRPLWQDLISFGVTAIVDAVKK